MATAKKREPTSLSIAINYQREIPNCEGNNCPILGIVEPKSKNECLAIVRYANENKIALYPVSTGKNWGFGSAVPPEPNGLIVRLNLLNRIKNFDPQLGTVEIEPGVTQEMLSIFLKENGDQFILDVTGSGKETSVLGNTLERGVGYEKLRHQSILSLEVLLGTGETVNTGFGHYPNSALHKCLATGLGPSLNEMFTQSNFGLVLGATLQLAPKPEYRIIVSYYLTEPSDFLQNVEYLRALFDQGIITCIPKVADRKRCETVFCARIFHDHKATGKSITREQCRELFNSIWKHHQWTVLMNVSGPKEVVKAKLKVLLDHPLCPASAIRVVDPENVTAGSFDELILDYSSGKPSDESLRSVYWDTQSHDPNPHQPENKPYGFRYAAFLLPNRSKDLEKFLEIYHALAKAFDFNPAATYNMLNRNTFEVVISFGFDKTNEFSESKSRNFVVQLRKSFLEAGYLPYRLDTPTMKLFYDSQDSSQETWSKLISDIKQSCDPQSGDCARSV